MRKIRRLIGCLLLVAALLVSNMSAAHAYTYVAQATVNVNMRSCASTSCSSVGILQGGQYFYITCYAYGESIYGDTVWYWGKTNPNNTWQAYVAGYYLTTGSDPNSHVVICSNGRG